MITTLSFDLDDTLWPIAPAIEAAEQALRDWLQRADALLAERAPRQHSLATLREQG